MTSKIEFLNIGENIVRVLTTSGVIEIRTCSELSRLFIKHEILGLTDVFKALAKILTLDGKCLRYLKDNLGEKHLLTILAKAIENRADEVLEKTLASEIKFRKIVELLDSSEPVLIHGISNSNVLEELVKLKPKIYIPEFRPYLVQAKLIAKTLANHGLNVTVITDNMVGYLMWKGEVKNMMTEGIVLNEKLVGRTGTLTYAISSYYSKVPANCISYNIIQGIYATNVFISENEDVKYLDGKLVSPEEAKTLYAHYDIVPLKYFRRNFFIRIV